MKDSNLDQLIAAWLDGRINESDSETLQQLLRESASARKTFRDFSKLDASLHSIAEGELDQLGQVTESVAPAASDLAPDVATTKPQPGTVGLGIRFWATMTLALGMLALVGGLAYQIGKVETENLSLGTPIVRIQDSGPAVEKTISGHATLRHVAEIKWSAGHPAYRVGDVLPAGEFKFDSGVVEIDFFCGATIVLEGPATISLDSDWSARLLAGRLRANVPPAARGFIVKAADSEIVDLGTEFALEVKPDSVRVEVVEGEVKLKGGLHNGKHLVTGEAKSLVGDPLDKNSFRDLSSIGDAQQRHQNEQRLRFGDWQRNSQQLRLDDRLIAYYPIAESTPDRFITNHASGGSELDGKIVGSVSHETGRFGQQSRSIGFERPGSRVRTLVDGKFGAFTFACWVRIDRLDHLYNALFMADGYENGEPHWQIHSDGRLMFSVMVDDTPGSGLGKAVDARLHHIYFTEPFWDESMKGQWMHLVSVYDPANREVRQFLNGERIGHEKIEDRFYVSDLSIGTAEIGNWGQPFRQLPDFAVRNLNGAIDELAIFDAALTEDEVKSMFEKGKPFGH